MGRNMDSARREAIRVALTLLMTVALVVGSAGPALAQNGSGKVAAPPKLTAKAWVLMDAENGQILLGHNANEHLSMASTAKIMSVLVTLDEGVDPGKEVTVSEKAASYAKPPYSNAGLYPYDRVSVDELIRGALIPSGIDAVYALAEAVGNGSVDIFVQKMNDEAKSMGLKDTHFANPAGLEAKGQYSSAHDLAEMAYAAMKYRLFRNTVNDIETTITTQDRKIHLVNTNLLLQYYPPATGIKTGTTPTAGENLVSSASKDGESYIAVVLDSSDRYSDSEALLDYAFNRYKHKPLLEKGKTYGSVELPYRRGESIKLKADKDVTGLVDAGSKIERKVDTGEPPPSAKAGEKLGTVDVLVNGKSAGESPLVATKGYKKASFWQKTGYRMGGWMRGLGHWINGLVK